MEPREYMQELRDCADQVTFDGDKEAWIVALCRGDQSHSDIMGLVHQRDEARAWAIQMKAERDEYHTWLERATEAHDRLYRVYQENKVLKAELAQAVTDHECCCKEYRRISARCQAQARRIAELTGGAI